MLTKLATAQSDNILVIVADDLGVDSLGVYAEGAAPAPTPNLDALAANGVLFRNASANAVCSPTRACLLTGRYAFRTGVGGPVGQSGVEGLPLHELTIPELLTSAGSGYAHACIGKWHLADTTNGGASSPNMAGFGHFAGLLGGGVNNYSRWPRNVNGVTQLNFDYTTTRMVDDALDWISTTTQPWFCVLNFNAPHSPFHAPPANLHTQNLGGLDPNTNPIPFYKAMVEAMDTEIGRLFSMLGAELAATNVIFLGDNGTPGQVSEPPFLSNHAKGTPFEGGVNVPLIVSGPSVVGPGREELAIVHAVDIFSTVLDLAGVEEPDYIRIDGVSFVPYLTDPLQSPLRSSMISESFSGGSGAIDTTGFVAARDAQYKYFRRVLANATIDRFYDLSVDPFETNDLSGGSMSPALQAAMQALEDVIDDTRHPSGSALPYGAACGGQNGAPAIQVSGTPSLGTTYTIELTSAPPATTTVLFIGASDSEWMGLPLPIDLGSLGGMAGCAIHASGEITVQLITDAMGAASWDFSVPNHPLALGAEIYHSFLIYDPSVGTSLPYITTAGIAVEIGE